MSFNQEDFNEVEMTFKDKQEIRHLFKVCRIDLGVRVTQVSLYLTNLVCYDIVIDMDWLESHEVVLYCKHKKNYFIDNSQEPITNIH